jgi:ATP-binding cassette, subfamily B, bacterial MsbA
VVLDHLSREAFFRVLQMKKKKNATMAGGKSELRRLFAFATPYRWALAGGLVSLIAVTGFALAVPQVLKLLIDAAFVEQDTAKLNRIMLFLIVAFAGQAVFAFFRSYLLSYVGERVVADLKTQVYDHLTTQSQAFFAERRIGELSSRLASDVGWVQSVTATTLGELLRQSLTLTGGIAIIAVTNPRLTAVMLSIVPIVVGGALLYGAYLRRIATRVQDRVADAAAILQESLSAVRIVQSFVREDYERSRYHERVNETLGLALRRSAAIGGFMAFMILVVFTGLSVVLWYGARLVIAGELTAGGLSSFILYMFVVAMSIGGIGDLYGGLQQAIGASRRIFELLDTPSEIRDPDFPQPLGNVTGAVRIESVRFLYPGVDTPVLDDVTIESEPGEIVALVGPSGAGKSTLISLIPRFYDVTAGRVLIDGQDIRNVRLAELRRAIGLVPQETILFGGTVRENIAYGKLDATDAEIEAAARAAHAHEFILECPEGYRTIIGERGVKLSGGQRQRIAIARALLKNPRILLLDEATSSLDTESERLVQNALEVLMEGRTTFVIAHRLSTVRNAHKIVVLDRGRVVEQGPHEELLRRGGLYKDLYELQFRDLPAPDAVHISPVPSGTP